ncbi:MAG: sugar phosphate isomerase/epimerase [Clostridiales bacterium]|nr:sugar phosphate isomerase/epimerase [Clostridiales bacterium]
MKFSLMTTTMVIDLLMEYQKGSGKEEITLKYADMLEMIARLGIPAVEITSIEEDLFGLEEIKKQLKKNHLEVGGFVHLDQYASTNPDRAEGIIALAKRRIDDAVPLGTDNLMLALIAQEDIEEHSRSELAEALIRNIRPIAEYGRRRGIMISVEDTPDIRLPLCNTADTKVLLDAIPELYLTYDSGNMILMHDSPITYLKAFQNRICHVHLKDMAYPEAGHSGDLDIDGRVIAGCMHGEGIVNFGEIGECLREFGYEGTLVIEYVGHDDHEKRIRDALACLQRELAL